VRGRSYAPAPLALRNGLVPERYATDWVLRRQADFSSSFGRLSSSKMRAASHRPRLSIWPFTSWVDSLPAARIPS